MPLYDAMIVKEEQCASGDVLFFPGVSTCTAVVCVMKDRLVGVHKTLSTNNIQYKRAMELVGQDIGNDNIVSLFVIGWVSKGHDVSAIKMVLGYQGTAYTCDFGSSSFKMHFGQTKMTDVGIMFSFVDGEHPKIQVKRTSKVTTQHGMHPDYGNKDPDRRLTAKATGMSGTVQTQHMHLITAGKCQKL